MGISRVGVFQRLSDGVEALYGLWDVGWEMVRGLLRVRGRYGIS